MSNSNFEGFGDIFEPPKSGLVSTASQTPFAPPPARSSRSATGWAAAKLAACRMTDYSLQHEINHYYYYYFYCCFLPRYSIPMEWKNYAMQYKKVQKSSWNETYSSSSFTKPSCSKMALYRWITRSSAIAEGPRDATVTFKVTQGHRYWCHSIGHRPPYVISF